MKKKIHIGSVSIPITTYAVQGTAILGTRESGKTYGAKHIVEQLLDAEVPPIIFDPIGRWRYLKIAGSDAGSAYAKPPRAYKIVVAGGESGDLPLTPQSAVEIVRAAIRENIPLVLDFYDKRLSKADWRRIVQSCFRTLLYENTGPRHIVLEEAAEFAPQKIEDGATYAEVEKLVRMGGNASLGITLLNQRAQEVNKAVLDLCDNVILMRQRGAHAIGAISKWMEKLTPGQTERIVKELPHMQSGDAWVLTGDSDSATRTRLGLIHSFHPDRRKPQLAAKAAAKLTISTEDFVTRLANELGEVIEESKATDPTHLKRRIHELESQLKKASAADPQELQQVIAKNQRLLVVIENLTKFVGQFQAQAGSLLSEAEGRLKDGKVEPGSIKREPFKVSIAPAKSLKPPPRNVTNLDGPLPKGEAAILAACIMYPNGVSREQLTVLTAYKRSSRDAYIQRLREKGYVETESATVIATDAGRAALPNAEPLPTGIELRDYWLQKLPEGECKILALLLAAHPNPVNRQDLDSAGYKRSSRDAYLQRLRARGLITEPARGQVQANNNLF